MKSYCCYVFMVVGLIAVVGFCHLVRATNKIS